MRDFDSFVRQFFETFLWSSSDCESGEPLDRDFSVKDIHPESRDRLVRECADFFEQVRRKGWIPPGREELAGHDFILSRNRHGAGFWDGDWPEFGDQLHELAKSYKEVYLMVGDDGLLHAERG